MTFSYLGSNTAAPAPKQSICQTAINKPSWTSRRCWSLESWRPAFCGAWALEMAGLRSVSRDSVNELGGWQFLGVTGSVPDYKQPIVIEWLSAQVSDFLASDSPSPQGCKGVV
jgi:hypothetical protein